MGVPSRARWWRPFWVFCLAAIVVVALVQYFYQGFLLGTVLEGVALALVCFGISYYIRVKPNQTVNRAIWILLGITPIGFLIMLVLIFTVYYFLIPYLGILSTSIIVFAVPYVIGAFIGDWIGKKRSYRLFMWPL
jgi:amino acid transporter